MLKPHYRFSFQATSNKLHNFGFHIKKMVGRPHKPPRVAFATVVFITVHGPGYKDEGPGPVAQVPRNLVRGKADFVAFCCLQF